jgi:hypothetical protein
MRVSDIEHLDRSAPLETKHGSYAQVQKSCFVAGTLASGPTLQTTRCDFDIRATRKPIEPLRKGSLP